MFKHYYTKISELESCNNVKFYRGYKNFRILAPKNNNKEKYRISIVNNKRYITFSDELNDKSSPAYKKLKSAIKKKMYKMVEDLRLYLDRFTEPKETFGINAWFIIAAYDSTDQQVYDRLRVFNRPHFTVLDEQGQNIELRPLIGAYSTESGSQIVNPTVDVPIVATPNENKNMEKIRPFIPNENEIIQPMLPHRPKIEFNLNGFWTVPQFIGGELSNSYLTLKLVSGLGGTESSVSLTFKTVDKEGILLFSMSKEGKQDFILIYLKEWRINLMIDLGKGIQKVVISKIKLLPNQFYTLNFIRIQNEFVLQVDDLDPYSAKYAPNAINLNIDEEIYLGGIPGDALVFLMPILHKQQYELDLPDKALTGCIKEISLFDFKPSLMSDSEYINFKKKSSMNQRMTENISECGSGPCATNPCQNDGKCHVIVSSKFSEDNPIVGQKYVPFCDCVGFFQGPNCMDLNLGDPKIQQADDKMNIDPKNVFKMLTGKEWKILPDFQLDRKKAQITEDMQRREIINNDPDRIQTRSLIPSQNHATRAKFQYFQPALARRSYMMFFQENREFYTNDFKTIAMPTESNGILLFLYGESSALVIFLHNYHLGILIKSPENQFMQISEKIILSKNNWYYLTFSMNYKTEIIRISADPYDQNAQSQKLQRKSLKMTIKPLNSQNFEKSKSFMTFDQNYYIGGPPDRFVLEKLKLNSSVFNFDRRVPLTDYGWSGSIQSFSLDGEYHDNLLKTARMFGNVSPYIDHACYGKSSGLFSSFRGFKKNTGNNNEIENQCQGDSICNPNFGQFYCDCQFSNYDKLCRVKNEGPQKLVRFTGKEFLQLSIVDNISRRKMPKKLEILINFRTNRPNGLIYLHKGQFQLIALSLHNSNLLLSTIESKKLRLSKKFYSDNKWHKLKISYTEPKIHSNQLLFKKFKISINDGKTRTFDGGSNFFKMRLQKRDLFQDYFMALSLKSYLGGFEVEHQSKTTATTSSRRKKSLFLKNRRRSNNSKFTKTRSNQNNLLRKYRSLAYRSTRSSPSNQLNSRFFIPEMHRLKFIGCMSAVINGHEVDFLSVLDDKDVVLQTCSGADEIRDEIHD